MLREPRIVEMAPEGDRRRFLCILEQEGGAIYGAAFSITPHDEESAIVWAGALELAWRRVRERAESGDVKPEGTDWDAFL